MAEQTQTDKREDEKIEENNKTMTDVHTDDTDLREGLAFEVSMAMFKQASSYEIADACLIFLATYFTREDVIRLVSLAFYDNFDHLLEHNQHYPSYCKSAIAAQARVALQVAIRPIGG